MPEELESLTALLREGLAVSMQGTYQRRLPSKAALPKIREARRGLRLLVRVAPSAAAWRTLALSEEALLHYPAALLALEKCIASSPELDRKDMKRMAALREYAANWQSLGLTPTLLEELGQHLDLTLRADSCDHTHRHTSCWLDAKGMRSQAKVIAALKKAGGYCDCEVLANVI